MFSTSLPSSVFFAFFASFAISVLILATIKFHGKYSMDSLHGIQKIHFKPTPRIGGVSLVGGVCAAWFVAKPERSEILGVLIIAGLPAFAFGLAEDLTKRVSIFSRLLATMVSGVIGWKLTGYSITSVDVTFFDALLGITFFSVFFTAFCVSGLSNAVNIIDGFNGLASGFVLIALIGLSIVADLVGDINLSFACLAIAGAVLGFFLFNWPFGKIFLGDGGSYFGGFCVAWASVLLIERNTVVTTFVPLLICIHPVVEVLFSIYRRRIRKLSPGHPDRLHLHSLVMRRVVRSTLNRYVSTELQKNSLLENSITGLLMICLSIPPLLSSLLVINVPGFAAFLCLSFAMFYLTLYARIVRFRWCSPITFLLPKRQVLFQIR